MKLIIGLTGPNAAGKSATADFLGNRGFSGHSLSDIVREEAGRRGLDHSRAHLITVGNDLRRAEGAGVLARRILSRLVAPALVDSIRNPAEVQDLRTLDGFRLLGVDAPLEVRFERSRRRGRMGDAATVEEFRRLEEVENSRDPAAQQLTATLQLADATLWNEGSVEDLCQALQRQVEAWAG